MRFTKAEPTDDNGGSGLYCRYVSETGVWELGLGRVIYGVRVKAGHIRSCGFVLEYCAGADPVFTAALLTTVMTILEQYPEDVPISQIERDFPSYAVKPISQDPCWPRLQELAKNAAINKTVGRATY